MNRVSAPADRENGICPGKAHPFTSLLPLADLPADILRVGKKAKKVRDGYPHFLEILGSELHILE